ncbi:uncharacterized protein LOC62_03G004944 [Vanrija pseudolonga]|uniref:Uncharacterized protein n=1 Tax=Vanrija pseudolonga TaxID=143232 RepID=A0AAF0YBM1_9TREE|nr:hypothetical protein LOC62_03G004944 [Vanrija pseudolonga]
MSVASARRDPSPAPPSILLNCGRAAGTSPSPTRVGIGFGAASPSKTPRTVKSSESLDAPSVSSAPTLSPGLSLGTSLSSEASWGAGSAPDDSPNSTLNPLPNGGGSSTPRSVSSTIGTGTSSPKIRFGECPERPPELRRRNSITLGVLARKNMLHAQGTVPVPRGGAQQGHIRSVYMTDAEWAEYQKQFSQKPGQVQAVDLGTVMSSGAKKLWGRVRRSSNTSTASVNSIRSAAPVLSGAASRGRSDSASGGAPAGVSPLVVPVHSAIVEEDEPPTPGPAGLGLDTGEAAGEQTPRRGRSPSPPPPTFDDDDDEEEDDSEPADEETQVVDDAEATHRQHQGHTAAVLGFELSEYDQNPAWDAEMRERQDVARLAHGLGQGRGSPAANGKAALDVSAEAANGVAATLASTAAAAATTIPPAEATTTTTTSPPIAIRRDSNSNSHARYAAEVQRRRDSAARERRLSAGSASPTTGTSPVAEVAAHMPRFF